MNHLVYEINILLSRSLLKILLTSSHIFSVLLSVVSDLPYDSKDEQKTVPLGVVCLGCL